jgi:serine/threonine protein kinase
MGRTPRSPRRPRRKRPATVTPAEFEPYDAGDPDVARRVLEPHYEVIRLLARGAVACTHLVRDREAGRELVARILRWEVAKDESARAHLRRLTRAGLALEHPNVVRTFAMSADEDRIPYAICEFVDGVDLATLLAQGGRLPPENAARLARDVAAALEAAHAKGIVHGSLRPADILATPGVRAKIYEFDSPLFGDSGVLGDPRYAAPEQLQDPGSGARAPADIFALGAILYEMLTGQDPFPATSPMQALRRKLDPEPHRRPSAAEVRTLLEPGDAGDRA